MNKNGVEWQPEVLVDALVLREAGYAEGYAKALDDLTSRLRVLELFTQEEHEECLQLVISTADTLKHTV